MKTPALETPPAHSPFAKWLPLALFLLVILFFKGVMSCQLVNLDDPTYVMDSPIHRGLTWQSFQWAFTNDFHASFYIPITWLSYATDVTLMGNKAEAFHLTNLLFHALNAVLVYFLICRFTEEKWRAFFVAAIWAVHPLRVESVAWVTERKDVLFAFFGLCSLLSYIQYTKITDQKRTAFYLLSLAAFALSLLSKPTLITFPFLLLLLDWWPLRRFRPKSFNLPLMLEKIPFLLFAIAIGIITLVIQHQAGAMMTTKVVDTTMRIETAICGYGQYLLQTIYPINLAALIAYPLFWPASQVLLSAAAMIILTAICFGLQRKNRECRAPLFGWIWFLLVMLPTCGLLQDGPQAYADRFTYFPAIGLILAIVFTIPANWWRQPNISKMMIGAFLLVITAEGLITIDQVKTWHDSGTLWTRTLAVSPNNIIARLNYAAFLLAETNDTQAGIDQCRWVAERFPNKAMAWCNWGVGLERQGHLEEALEKYYQAESLEPAQPLYQEHVQRIQSLIRAKTMPAH